MSIIQRILLIAFLFLVCIVALDYANTSELTSSKVDGDLSCFTEEDFEGYSTHEINTAKILCSFQKKCVVDIVMLDNEMFDVECGDRQ